MNLRDIFLAGAFAQGGGAVSPEQIDQAVNDYLDTNPVGVDLAMTGATVGQIAKITAVDASGVPTAWEPVDLPSGGGEEGWEHICDISVVEDEENPINTVEQELGAKYRKVRVVINKNSAGGLVVSGSDSYPLRIFANWNTNTNIVGGFPTGVTSIGWSIYDCEIECNMEIGIITGVSTIGNGSFTKFTNTNLKDTIYKLIFSNNGGGIVTCTINIYGVRA